MPLRVFFLFFSCFCVFKEEKTPGIADSLSLSAGFCYCSLLFVPHPQWEVKKEENWERNVEEKNPQLLLWRNLAGVTFASRMSRLRSGWGRRSCVSLLFLVFLLEYSPWNIKLPMGSAWFWVAFSFFLNLTIPKKWIIKKIYIFNTKSPGCFPPDKANVDEMLSSKYLSDLLR